MFVGESPWFVRPQGREFLRSGHLVSRLKTEARKKDDGAVRCRESLGGLLKYYEREAAYA
jgi:hypothetical protein